MRQIFLSTCILFFTLAMYGQKDVTFINQELKNLEVKLVKKGEYLKLSNQQIEQLTKVFEDKGQRIATIKRKNVDKDAISSALLQLEEEFVPRVSTVLNKAQRIALQSVVTTTK